MAGGKEDEANYFTGVDADCRRRLDILGSKNVMGPTTNFALFTDGEGVCWREP
jgi:hypothetical protein